jgi:hypothetical protein
MHTVLFERTSVFVSAKHTPPYLFLGYVKNVNTIAPFFLLFREEELFLHVLAIQLGRVYPIG